MQAGTNLVAIHKLFVVQMWSVTASVVVGKTITRNANTDILVVANMDGAERQTNIAEETLLVGVGTQVLGTTKARANSRSPSGSVLK